jgi:transposase
VAHMYNAYWIGLADGLPASHGTKRKFCARCIVLIFRLAHGGESHRQIAQRFGASPSTIGDILTRRRYASIPIAAELLPPNIYPAHGGRPRKHDQPRAAPVTD